ncbi:MAG: tRNA pseudouridine(38-40) synthase TruA [Planctomycetota bacterium]
MPETCRYKLTVAYDGSAFHGWQKQQPKDRPWPRTVEGELEQTLMRVLRQPSEAIGLLGASRTDAGVHATGQVCHFNAQTPIPLERLCQAINSRLPEDLEARQVEVVHEDFDAIRDATDKQYRYRVLNAPHRPLGLRHLVYHEWNPMELVAMRDAAARLVGTHDVEGFASAAHGRQTTVRTIHDCQIEEHPLPGGYAAAGSPGRELHVVISGSGFLYHMVRIVAGTMVEVGLGRIPPAQIDQVLLTGDRRRAGPTLPARGLCLEWIRHAEPTSSRRREDAKTQSKAEAEGVGDV